MLAACKYHVIMESLHIILHLPLHGISIHTHAINMKFCTSPATAKYMAGGPLQWHSGDTALCDAGYLGRCMVRIPWSPCVHWIGMLMILAEWKWIVE